MHFWSEPLVLELSRSHWNGEDSWHEEQYCPLSIGHALPWSALITIFSHSDSSVGSKPFELPHKLLLASKKSKVVVVFCLSFSAQVLVSISGQLCALIDLWLSFRCRYGFRTDGPSSGRKRTQRKDRVDQPTTPTHKLVPESQSRKRNWRGGNTRGKTENL